MTEIVQILFIEEMTENLGSVSEMYDSLHTWCLKTKTLI